MPAVGDGAFLADLPAGVIDELLALAGPGVDAPVQSIEIHRLGGALARETPGGGTQPKIDAKYAMFAGGFPPTPGLRHATRSGVRALKDELT